jgi:hypothetical protein
MMSTVFDSVSNFQTKKPLFQGSSDCNILTETPLVSLPQTTCVFLELGNFSLIPGSRIPIGSFVLSLTLLLSRSMLQILDNEPKLLHFFLQ